MSDSILFPSWTSYNSPTLLMRNMLGSTGFVIIIHIFFKGNCLQQNLWVLYLES